MILVLASGALAQSSEAGPLSVREGAADPFALPLKSETDLLAQRVLAEEADTTRAEPDARIEEAGEKKKPAVAGLLSAAVPGAGQFYNGSSMGYLFLGVEAAAWISYFWMHDTGMDEQDEFKRYADAHWSWDRYRDPTFEDCPPNGHSDDGVQDSILVYLYDTRRDDFYEDIGKLDIYSCGWDTQTNRAEYMDMRDNSNDFLRGARYATTIIFLNHIVSAVHAARGAVKHNASLAGRTTLDLDWSMSLENPAARLTVSRTF